MVLLLNTYRLSYLHIYIVNSTNAAYNLLKISIYKKIHKDTLKALRIANISKIEVSAFHSLTD